MSIKQLLLFSCAILMQCHFLMANLESLKSVLIEDQSCYCDLRPRECDFPCCCDKDCENKDTSQLGLSCINENAFYSEAWSCNSSESLKSLRSDWWPLLCLEKSNSPLIGTFHPMIADLDSKKSFDEIIKVFGRTSQNFQTKTPSLLSAKPSRQLRLGSLMWTESDSGLKQFKFFGQGMDGRCVKMPQRFLINKPIVFCPLDSAVTKDYCQVVMKEELDELVENLKNLVISSEKDNLSGHKVDLMFFELEQDRNAKYFDLNSLQSNFDNSKKYSIKSLIRPQKNLRQLSSNCVLNPMWDERSNACFNAIIETKVEIGWKSSNIKKIIVKIVLGKLDKRKSQMFNLNFVHFGNKTDNFQHKITKIDEDDISKNETDSNEVNKRVNNERRSLNRGKKNNMTGYEWASPLLFRDDQPLMLIAGSDKDSCQLSNSSILFGLNTRTSCSLRLSKSNFSSDGCKMLNVFMERLVSTLIDDVHYLARGGAEMPDKNEDFLPILRSNWTSPKTLTYIENFKACRVISGYVLHVLYAESKLNGTVIRRVAGAQIKPLIGVWQYKCLINEALSNNCALNKLSFEVSSIVHFQRIPSIWELEKTSSFWIKQDLAHCSQDICFHHLLYPLTHNDDRVQVAQIVVALFVAFITALLLHCSRSKM